MGLPGWWCLGENLVEQQIDDHAGDRDIHPQGEGPAGKGFVPLELSVKSQSKGDEDERYDEDCQQGMAQEQSQVEGSKLNRFLKTSRSNVGMVVQVTRQKKGGTNEGCDHAISVSFPLSAMDAPATYREQKGAEPVQSGIDRRQIVNRHFNPKLNDNWIPATVTRVESHIAETPAAAGLLMDEVERGRQTTPPITK